MARREVPHNTEAERALLGSVLIDPRCIDEVAPVVRAKDFYEFRHKFVYETMLTMRRERKAIDFLTLQAHIEAAGKGKVADGAYLSELIGAVPSAINAVHYARLVAATGTRRELLDAANALAKLAYDEGLAVEEAIGQAETAVFSVRRQHSGHLMSIGEAVSNVYDEFELIQQGKLPAAVPTGYADLDRYLTGWRRQEQTIIAARPGIGKTALLLALAIYSAKAGYGTLIFSAEMSYKMLVKRALQAAGVGNLPGLSREVDWSGISDHMGQLADLPLWIDDTPNIGIADLRAKAMRLGADQRIDHIFVDYVQLLRGARRREKRYLELGDISKQLKQTAREMDNHVCTAAQLSRQAEGQRPTLDTLKESGALEEDADNVILLHRQRETPAGAPVVATDVIVAKQRNGPTGSLQLGWMPKRVTFVPLQRGGGQ